MTRARRGFPGRRSASRCGRTTCSSSCGSSCRRRKAARRATARFGAWRRSGPPCAPAGGGPPASSRSGKSGAAAGGEVAQDLAEARAVPDQRHGRFRDRLQVRRPASRATRSSCRPSRSSPRSSIRWRIGAKVVLADVDPRTLNMDPADVARKITPRTQDDHAGAHRRLAGRHGPDHARWPGSTTWSVIEDAAHALRRRRTSGRHGWAPSATSAPSASTR